MIEVVFDVIYDYISLSNLNIDLRLLYDYLFEFCEMILDITQLNIVVRE